MINLFLDFSSFSSFSFFFIFRFLICFSEFKLLFTCLVHLRTCLSFTGSGDASLNASDDVDWSTVRFDVLVPWSETDWEFAACLESSSLGDSMSSRKGNSGMVYWFRGKIPPTLNPETAFPLDADFPQIWFNENQIIA